MDHRFYRAIETAKKQVKNLSLDLKNLTVLTECASGAYSFTPVMALMAGARVFAVGKDSSYGTFEANKNAIEKTVQLCDLPIRHIDFIKDNVTEEIFRKIDIVTNSGFLRPLTNEKIRMLNRKAVIALMWETWELRKGEIDVVACQKNGIPVIGTNENFDGADMYDYPGMLALKLLLESGFEVVNNDIVLLGGGLTGRLIAQTFKKLGLKFIWFTGDGKETLTKNYPYSELHLILEQQNVDVILCADHVFTSEIIGKKSKVTFEQLKKKFPCLEWCHLTGSIDADELKDSGINFYPFVIRSHGYMSYDTFNLGWGPVIILNSAGLKVGELAAKERLKGGSLESSIQAAVEYGIGQDFPGGFMNFKI